MSGGLPDTVRRTSLWQRVALRQEYALVTEEIRRKAALLAQRTWAAMPEYTDHSLFHMDRLWEVSCQVLAEREIQSLTPSEAFLLAASFYIHDLGMALPATAEGREEIHGSPEYSAAYRRFATLAQGPEAEALATREATRQLHAKESVRLATTPLPGLDEYLIADPDFRDRWGEALGQIAESHHWDLDEIDRTLGPRRAEPGPDSYTVDYAYVACVLGIVDFAHINRDRAPRLEFGLRTGLPRESAIHWAAQANITGPVRDGDLLAYGCTRPVQDIDAWWLFYDMASALDAQIRSVYEFLAGRTVSANRLSLQGVRAAESPAAFSRCVRLREGVAPIDVRVQPDSMERVVEFLGGKRIYGPDKWAPLRELIQNARDAVELRTFHDAALGLTAAPAEIGVLVKSQSTRQILVVRDTGVGMTRRVIKKYLLGVGSDFWHSPLFYRDFGQALDAGFRPIGKFGIGFLSIFMLGDEIEVVTETRRGQRSRLKLFGVGRRGELSEESPTGRCGTEVSVVLREEAIPLVANLFEVVQARAPMLTVPVVVTVETEAGSTSQRIAPGWWRTAPERELISFIRDWRITAHRGGEARDTPGNVVWRASPYDPEFAYRSPFERGSSESGWPGTKPEYVDPSKRIISLGAPQGAVVRCSQGVAVDLIHVPGAVGLVDVGQVELTASRSAVAGAGETGDRSRNETLATELIADLRPAVVTGIDRLAEYGMLPGRINLIRGLGSVFGPQVLEQARLAWIPVTLPPGDLIHHPRSGLLELARKHGRALLAIGLTPGSAYTAAATGVDTNELGKMPLIAIAVHEVRVGYDEERLLDSKGAGGSLTGSLQKVLMEAEVEDPALVLTIFILRTLAEAWSVPVADLEAQEWHLLYKSSELWARLTDPARV